MMSARGLALLLLLSASLAVAGEFSEPAPRLGKELVALLAKPESELNLGEAALWVAREEYPALDIAAALKTLDALAARLAPLLAKADTAAAKLDALRKFCFDDEKFGLPLKDDATAFLLSDVLQHKRGNCLGLSVLILALAERAGLSGKLHGVPVPSRLSGPGHLLIRYDDGASRLNFDPTEKGAAHPDSHYRELFKLRAEDQKDAYILGNAKKKEIVNLLLINLGAARIEANRGNDALPLLAQAIVLKANYAPAHMNLGAARSCVGDLTGAEAAFRKALQLDRNLIGAHLGLADAALQRDDLAAVEKELALVEALESNLPQTRCLRAGVHAARGEFAQAKAVLTEVLQGDPKNQSLRCNIAAICNALGEAAEAAAIYQAVIAADAKSAQAHYGLAEVLVAAGKTGEARAEYELALAADARHAPTRLVLAHQKNLSGDFSGAEAAYREILKLKPSYVYTLKAWHGLAVSLLAQKKTAEADRALTQAVKLYPENLELAKLCGETKLATKDYAGALSSFKVWLAKAGDEEKPRLLEKIAVCHGKAGEHKKALEAAQEMLKLDPNSLPALRLCATANEGLRNGVAAAEYYKKILAVAPGDEAAAKALMRLSR